MCFAFESLSVRRKRRLVAFLYHLSVVVICLTGIRVGLVFNSPTVLNISSLTLIAHALTFRVIPVSRWIQEEFIPEAVCFGCGAAIELVGLYRCGCGFVSHKERHAFSPCPMCGKYFLWITCPECETSIPI